MDFYELEARRVLAIPFRLPHSAPPPSPPNHPTTHSFLWLYKGMKWITFLFWYNIFNLFYVVLKGGGLSLGCSVYENPDEVRGKAVMVSRGDCTFIEKATFAHDAGSWPFFATLVPRPFPAGARLLIIANTNDTITAMSGTTSIGDHIQVVMMSKSNADHVSKTLLFEFLSNPDTYLSRKQTIPFFVSDLLPRLQFLTRN